MDRLGDVLLVMGDLAGAKRYFERNVEVLQGLTKANPTSIQAQRNFGVSLEKLGTVLVETGKLPEARQRFEQACRI